MNWTLLGIIALVVVLIAGPFATLRAVSSYKQRRLKKLPPPLPDDDNDPDKPSGFW